MANHAHNASNFICRIDASEFALLADRGWKSVLVSLVDCCLVQADSRCMDVHVRKDDIWIREAIRKLQMRR